MALLTADTIPVWLQILALAYLSIGFGTAGYMVYDIIINRHKNKMKIMNIVWPVNGFYLGPLALWAYWHIGHMNVKKEQKDEGQTQDDQNEQQQNKKNKKDTQSHDDVSYSMPSKIIKEQKKEMRHNTISSSKQFDHPIPTHAEKTGGKQKKPMRETVFVSATHCGAGCMLGDVVGEWIVFLGTLTIAGVFLWSYYLVDYALAWTLGILFQNASIMQMRKKSFKEGLPQAIKADTLSLTMFEIGLFGWMAFSYFVIFGGTLHPESPVYWFSMQFGMILGFFTSYPANWLLVQKGIKEGM